MLLTEAPLVEGAVAAAVAAGLGESLEKVAAEARGGLAAKAAHLAAGSAAAPDADADRLEPTASGMLERCASPCATDSACTRGRPPRSCAPRPASTPTWPSPTSRTAAAR